MVYARVYGRPQGCLRENFGQGRGHSDPFQLNEFNREIRAEKKLRKKVKSMEKIKKRHD